MNLTGGKLDIIWAAGYVILVMIAILAIKWKLEGAVKK